MLPDRGFGRAKTVEGGGVSLDFFEPILGHPVVPCVRLLRIVGYGDLVNPSAVAELRGDHIALVRGIVSVVDADFVHFRKSRFHWQSIGDSSTARKREIMFSLRRAQRCG